jgi:DNA-binding IclR family transcriptional regulator
MKSLKSALDILDIFTSDTPEQGVMEISRKLLMNKSKVSRILSSFADRKILIKSESNQKYRLGSKVLELATVYLSKRNLKTMALPYLEALNRDTNETVAVFILEGKDRVCLDRIESTQEVRMSIKPGDHHPLHAGAAGKLILAFLSEEKRKELIEKKLTHFTKYTITSKRKLRKELAKIRKQAFAISIQERVSFGAAVAAPIKDYSGELIGALSVVGPAMRFTPEKVMKFVTLAKANANKISQQLGYLGYPLKTKVDFGTADVS